MTRHHHHHHHHDTITKFVRLLVITSLSVSWLLLTTTTVGLVTASPINQTNTTNTTSNSSSSSNTSNTTTTTTTTKPATAVEPSPTSPYENNLVLPSHHPYHIYWNHTNESITFEVHVQNATWLVFGLKGKWYSDVIVAAVFADGTGHFSERIIGNTNYTLTFKNTTNWRLLDAFKTSTNFTVVKFTRSIKLACTHTPASTSTTTTTGTTNGPNHHPVGLDIVRGQNRLVLATGVWFDQVDYAITIGHLYSKHVNLLPAVVSESQLNKCGGGGVESRSAAAVSTSSAGFAQLFNSTPTSFYTHQVDLIPGGVYRLYWNVTRTNVTAEVHVKTDGWVGFGFSPSGGMIDSNVVVGYFSANGSVHFSDRHIDAPSASGIVMTRNQSVHLLAAGRTNGYVFFKFTRFINICDSQHVSIKQGIVNLIYAYGSEPLGPGEDISYHGFNRGTAKLNMISVANSDDPVPTDTDFVDFTVKNVIIPKVETFYYSKVFEVPSWLDKKRHIYMYEMILSEVNKKNIHRVVILECPSTYMGHPAQKTYDSFKDIVTATICKTVSYVWGSGSELKLVLPSTTGYPIGGDTDYSFIVMEVHYSNPKMEIGFIDSITLRCHLTKQLRPNELGMLTVGTLPSSQGIILPPDVSKFTIQSYCHATCIKNAFYQNPIMDNLTIIGSLLHTHIAGVSVDTKIIRNGVDMGTIFANHQFDYKYQQMYMLKPFVNITKDDELVSQCTYSTSGRQRFTVGGYGSKDEMCSNYMFYYPRGWLRRCSSIPYLNDQIDFLNDLSKSGDLNLGFKLDYNHRNLTFGIDQAIEQLSKKPASSQLKNHFVQFYNTTRVSEFCGDFLDLGPKERLVPVNKFFEPNLCQL